MSTPLVVLGIVVSLVLLWATQEWFRKEYLRRHAPLRLDGRIRPFWGPGERAVLFAALTHPHPDPAMERIRRVAIALLLLALIAFTALSLQLLGRTLK